MEKGLSDFKSDFGFMAPHRTTSKCKNPEFADHHYHRIAVMKDYHIGSKGDIEDTGMPGWITKFICTGCGKQYKIGGHYGYFYRDSQVSVGV